MLEYSKTTVCLHYHSQFKVRHYEPCNNFIKKFVKMLGLTLDYLLFFFGQPTVCNGLRIIIGFLTNGERIAARALYARTHHLSQLPAPYRLQRDLEPFIES